MSILFCTAYANVKIKNFKKMLNVFIILGEKINLKGVTDVYYW